MTKSEKTVIGLFLGTMCPFLLFLLCWWLAASISLIQIAEISQDTIKIIAIGGFLTGCILDIFYLRQWVGQFYTFKRGLLSLLYLACSAPALAVFMGLPFGNIILGTLAGVYIGRRAFHEGMKKESLSKTATRTGLFTAAITGIESMFIGFLGLNERIVQQFVQLIVGLGRSRVHSRIGIGLVIILSLAVMIVQFCCTKLAGQLVYGSDKV